MDKKESAIPFPCDFPIKAMGLRRDGLEDLLFDIVQPLDPQLDRSKITSQNSRHGKYMSVTLQVYAVSQLQLDGIYRAITSCDKVLYTL